MRRRILALSAVAALTMAGTVRASAIPVPDGSFESDGTGWNQFNQPSSGQWTVTTTISNGNWWGTGIYNGTAGQGSPSDGSQFFSMYPGLAPAFNTAYGPMTLSGAAFPVTTTAGNTYTAAVDISRCPAFNTLQPPYAGSTNVTINLMEGATVLASGTGSIGAAGIWSNVATVPFTATDSALHNLSIQVVTDSFYGDPTNWYATNVNLDNVTLSETVVPEPTIIGLVGLSSLGLLVRRRK